MAGILTHEQKQLAFRLRARGWRLVDIAREVGCTAPMVGLMVRDGLFTSGVPDEWEARAGCLTIAEREEILVGLRAGESLSAIARRLGRSPSTVSREVAANGGRERYSAWRGAPASPRSGPSTEAVQAARRSAVRRGRPRLLELWSPDEIARRLRVGVPGRSGDAGEPRDDLPVAVRAGPRRTAPGAGPLPALGAQRPQAARRGRMRRGRIPGMVMISERPAEVEDRAVPGHWEGDLILGEGGRSAVGTLVERTTRLVCCLHLDGGRSAASVEAAMRKPIATLPDELRRSITWDQGAEMANHASFTIDTGIPIYFCDPHAPGSAAPTRTPTVCCANTCPRAPTSPTHSAADLERIQPQPQQPASQDPRLHDTIRGLHTGRCAHRLNPPAFHFATFYHFRRSSARLAAAVRLPVGQNDDGCLCARGSGRDRRGAVRPLPPAGRGQREQYGGRYLVRGGESEVLEGERVPNRLVVLEFPDADTARRLVPLGGVRRGEGGACRRRGRQLHLSSEGDS